MKHYTEEELTEIFNKYDKPFNQERYLQAEFLTDLNVQNYARYLVYIHES